MGDGERALAFDDVLTYLDLTLPSLSTADSSPLMYSQATRQGASKSVNCYSTSPPSISSILYLKTLESA